MSGCPVMHGDGSITLPPNPFGTAATWADYNWRGIAARLREELAGASAASVAIDLIADAVEHRRGPAVWRPVASSRPAQEDGEQ